jgi:hypothetical protein
VSFAAINFCVASQCLLLLSISLSTQSRNFWIHPRTLRSLLSLGLRPAQDVDVWKLSIVQGKKEDFWDERSVHRKTSTYAGLHNAEMRVYTCITGAGFELAFTVFQRLKAYAPWPCDHCAWCGIWNVFTTVKIQVEVFCFVTPRSAVLDLKRSALP